MTMVKSHFNDANHIQITRLKSTVFRDWKEALSNVAPVIRYSSESYLPLSLESDQCKNS
jgi:hypothetical protein